jgi:hypothetical protein
MTERPIAHARRESLYSRIKSRTIWAPGAIPASEGRASYVLKRRILPTYDVLLIIAGIFAVRGGLPSFGFVYDELVANVAGYGVILSAAVALIGLAFPSMWATEYTAKYVLLAIVGLYGIVMVGRALLEEPTFGFVGVGMLALTILPVWRLSILGKEWNVRRNQARIVRALREGGLH